MKKLLMTVGLLSLILAFGCGKKDENNPTPAPAPSQPNPVGPAPAPVVPGTNCAVAPGTPINPQNNAPYASTLPGYYGDNTLTLSIASTAAYNPGYGYNPQQIQQRITVVGSGTFYFPDLARFSTQMGPQIPGYIQPNTQSLNYNLCLSSTQPSGGTPSPGFLYPDYSLQLTLFGTVQSPYANSGPFYNGPNNQTIRMDVQGRLIVQSNRIQGNVTVTQLPIPGQPQYYYSQPLYYQAY